MHYWLSLGIRKHKLAVADIQFLFLNGVLIPPRLETYALLVNNFLGPVVLAVDA